MREFQRSNHFVSQDLNIRTDPPAAKAWQVSRHTPTLVWSLTWSMMLLSSEKRPPTVLPWPLMFSNTDHIEGRQRRDGHQFQDTTLDTLECTSFLQHSVGFFFKKRKNRSNSGFKCLCIVQMVFQVCDSSESDM